MKIDDASTDIIKTDDAASDVTVAVVDTNVNVS
jgi:hypothetical protein